MKAPSIEQCRTCGAELQPEDFPLMCMACAYRDPVELIEQARVRDFLEPL